MRAIILSVMAIGALTACAQQAALREKEMAAAAAAERFDEGERLAERICINCHAIGSTGESRLEDAPPLRTLAERYPGSLLVDGFRQRMEIGHPSMPEFAFNADEMDALLEYLLAIQERRTV